MRKQDLLLLVLFNVIWAGSLSAYKALGEYLPTGGIVTIRFGLAAIISILILPFFKGSFPSGINLIKTILMGTIVFCLGHRLQVAGNNLGSAGNSAVLMALEPLLVSIAAAIFLREKIEKRRWAGFTLGMFGVALLNGVWRADFQWTGLTASLLFISSFLCETAYSVIGKPIITKSSPAKVLSIALISGTIANLCIDGSKTLPAIPTLPLNAWLIFIYLALLCTVSGYLAWYYIIKRTDVNIVALTIFIQPIAGIPMAIIFLGEKLHIGQLWGGLAIICALIIGLSGNNNNNNKNHSSK